MQKRKSQKIIDTIHRTEARSMHGQLPVVWETADNHIVTDVNKKKYIDFTSGICVANAGHGNDEIIKAIERVIYNPLLHSYTFYTKERADFLEYLIKNTPDFIEKAFLVSSGTEATECAIKLMKMYGKEKRPNIISFYGAMHGRTLGAEFLKGNPLWVGYWVPSPIHIPFPSKKDNWKQWLDFMKINPNKVCGIMIECFPNELILGTNKYAKELKVGDKILTKTGISKILNTYKKEIDNELIKISCPGILPILVTKEHPLYCSYSLNGNRPINEELKWYKAQDLQIKNRHENGHYVSLQRIKGKINKKVLNLKKYKKFLSQKQPKYTKFILDEDLSWIFGLYVADGSQFKKAFQISLNKKEINMAHHIKNIFTKKLGYKVNIGKKYNNCIRVTVRAGIIAGALKDFCGYKSNNKKIPDFILYHKNPKILQSFLNGYMDGDGSNYKSYGNIIGKEACTVSKLLALQLQLAYARLGKYARIYHHKEKKQIIKGREYNCQKVYHLTINNKPNKDVLVKDKYILIPIRKIEKIQYKGTIYNFHTEDNTITLNNVITHNTYQGWSAKFYPEKYIQNLCKWAKENNIIICFDEIQGGMGRTGKLFNYMHYGVEPDLVCVGKGFSSSIPLSGVLGRKWILDIPEVGSMSSTHSANPLACAVGLANFKEIQRILPSVASKSKILFKGLQQIFPKFEINGKGLLAGIITSSKEYADKVCYRAMEKGLLLIKTGRESIKIAPPLCISKENLIGGLQIIKNIIKKL